MHSTSGGVQRIDLGAALPVILEAYPHRQGEKIGEALLEPLVAGDLTANVADHPAEAGAQELEFSPRPIELVGMGFPIPPFNWTPCLSVLISVSAGPAQLRRQPGGSGRPGSFDDLVGADLGSIAAPMAMPMTASGAEPSSYLNSAATGLAPHPTLGEFS